MPDDDLDNFNPFEELDAASARLDADADKNIWGRKKQTRPDWRPVLPRRKNKLTPEQKAEIVNQYTGHNAKQLAERYDVAVGYIYNVVSAAKHSQPRLRTGSASAGAPKRPPATATHSPPAAYSITTDGVARIPPVELAIRLRVIVEVVTG